MTQTITSLEGFVRKIRAVTPADDEVLVYRGHSNRREFKLIPFVLREQKFKDAEETIRIKGSRLELNSDLAY